LGLEEDNQGESVMEMHSRRSLYKIHGISAPLRRQLRQSPIARLTIAQILIALRRQMNAIEAKLAARHAITELASLDDRMLLDLGITRSEIESAVRGSRANVATTDDPLLSNDSCRTSPVLPTVSSPDLTPDGQPERQLRRSQSW
jgi:uncharacterized protein YjiS (DUF1127 family)